ncbi:WGR domain-containing protein, partial [Leptospira santarosai]
MKKYLTFKDDKSDKFWNIEVDGNSFTVTYGKTGTSGQTQTKTFDNEQECLNEIDRLIKEKIEKNYIPEKNDIYFWLGTDGHENVYMQKEKGLNSHISLI